MRYDKHKKDNEKKWIHKWGHIDLQCRSKDTMFSWEKRWWIRTVKHLAVVSIYLASSWDFCYLRTKLLRRDLPFYFHHSIFVFKQNTTTRPELHIYTTALWHKKKPFPGRFVHLNSLHPLILLLTVGRCCRFGRRVHRINILFPSQEITRRRWFRQIAEQRQRFVARKADIVSVPLFVAAEMRSPYRSTLTDFWTVR